MKIVCIDVCIVIYLLSHWECKEIRELMLCWASFHLLNSLCCLCRPRFFVVVLFLLNVCAIQLQTWLWQPIQRPAHWLRTQQIRTNIYISAAAIRSVECFDTFTLFAFHRQPHYSICSFWMHLRCIFWSAMHANIRAMYRWLCVNGWSFLASLWRGARRGDCWILRQMPDSSHRSVDLCCPISTKTRILDSPHLWDSIIVVGNTKFDRLSAVIHDKWRTTVLWCLDLFDPQDIVFLQWCGTLLRSWCSAVVFLILTLKAIHALLFEQSFTVNRTGKYDTDQPL